MGHTVERGPVSRRGLLKKGAAAVAALTAASGRPSAASAQGAAGTPKNMRVSLAAYSVRQALKAGDMDLFGFIDWCAEMDLSGAELTSYYFRENFDTGYLHELKRRAHRQGVTISGTAIANNFCHPPGEERRKQIDHVKQWIDHAVEFFAPHIRVFAGNVPDGVDNKTAIGWAAESMRECLDYAAEKGVFLGLENHGGVT
ncbi:MAG: TIM barrel protein, partial [Candidatus Latescibacteria bacterium]|nr:TIM barrel protein [Candidatus Latescibacterota bacterium]